MTEPVTVPYHQAARARCRRAGGFKISGEKEETGGNG
jgi:hypothetical protein